MEQAQAAVSARHDATMRARAISVAHRMLGGAGRASMVAYHLAPDVEATALCHGVNSDGDLVVACTVHSQNPLTVWGHAPLQVRFDIVKEAPEWSVRITACAVHLLGILQWLPADALPGYLADPALHPRLVELASAQGGRLGVIRTDRVLLHDVSGVIPLAFDEIAERHLAGSHGHYGGFPNLDEEWTTRELIGQLSPADVADLLCAASAGWDAAIPLSKGDTAGCLHLDGHVFCVDVDQTGLTLMEIDSGQTAVWLFAFDQPANNIGELPDRMSQLLESGLRISESRR